MSSIFSTRPRPFMLSNLPDLVLFTLQWLGASLLLHTVQHLPAAQAVKVNNNPQIRVTTSFLNFDARIMDAWSGGGGKGGKWTIELDSGHPFANRSFGGSGRGAVISGMAYGSGYEYDNQDSTSVAGRGFPFGTWPIYWDGNVKGCDEYGPALDGIRPGGQLVTIAVNASDASTTSDPSSSAPPRYPNRLPGEIYYVIGDRDSAIAIMQSFVTWCDAKPAWPIKFNPGSNTSVAQMENVVRYYRASSFALATPLYNNTNARNLPTNAPDSDSTPVPDSILNSEFYQCLEGVIPNALIIMNKPPQKTSKAQLYGIMFGIFGIPMLGALFFIYGCVASFISSQRRAAVRRRQRRADNEKTRKAGLAYENFP